jgi:hypothetical protein
MTNGDTFRILMNILVRRVIKRLLELMMLHESSGGCGNLV